MLFLDALRHKPHPTHSTVAALYRNGLVTAGETNFLHAHVSRRRAHAVTEATLPPGVLLAYDGLEIEVPAA